MSGQGLSGRVASRLAVLHFALCHSRDAASKLAQARYTLGVAVAGAPPAATPEQQLGEKQKQRPQPALLGYLLVDAILVPISTSRP
jgi:hypothetical protein